MAAQWLTVQQDVEGLWLRRGHFLCFWVAFTGGSVLTLLFQVLLEKCTEMGRVALQHGGRLGCLQSQSAYNLPLHRGQRWQLGVADHPLLAEQCILNAGPCVNASGRGRVGERKIAVIHMYRWKTAYWFTCITNRGYLKSTSVI